MTVSRYKAPLLTSLVMAISILATPLWSFADEEIVILAYDNDPPYVKINPAGLPEGIVIEMLHYVEKMIPYSFTYRLVPWKRAYYSAKLGEGAIIGISKNAKRLEFFDYSDVLYYHDISIVVLKGNEFTFNDYSDFQGKTIAVHRGSIYNEEYAAALNSGVFEVYETDSREQRLQMLLFGRVDAALIGSGRLGIQLAINKASILENHSDSFSILPKPLLRDYNYLAISKELNAAPFIDSFNRAMQIGKRSGEFDKMQTQFLLKMRIDNQKKRGHAE